MFYVHQIIFIYQLLQFGFAQFAAAVDRLLAIGWVGGGRARRQGSHYMILFFLEVFFCLVWTLISLCQTLSHSDLGQVFTFSLWVMEHCC